MKEITNKADVQISVEKKDKGYYLYFYDSKTWCKVCIEITDADAARLQKEFNLEIALAIF